jgi:hypothetical protein
MVEVTIKTPSQQMKDRVARLQEISKRPGLRVEPANDTMRRLLKHPHGGGFRSSGSIEWPDDTFTRRRLRDGDIKLVEGDKEEEAGDDRPRRRSRSSEA